MNREHLINHYPLSDEAAYEIYQLLNHLLDDIEIHYFQQIQQHLKNQRRKNLINSNLTNNQPPF